VGAEERVSRAGRGAVQTSSIWARSHRRRISRTCDACVGGRKRERARGLGRGRAPSARRWRGATGDVGRALLWLSTARHVCQRKSAGPQSRFARSSRSRRDARGRLGRVEGGRGGQGGRGRGAGRARRRGLARRFRPRALSSGSWLGISAEPAKRQRPPANVLFKAVQGGRAPRARARLDTLEGDPSEGPRDSRASRSRAPSPSPSASLTAHTRATALNRPPRSPNFGPFGRNPRAIMRLAQAAASARGHTWSSRWR